MAERRCARPSYANLDYVMDMIRNGRDEFDKKLASVMDDIYYSGAPRLHDELLDLGIAFIMYRDAKLRAEEAARNARR
ncbi:hypothetical protein IU485_27550 [Nocardia cyriacigeorgica]|uniref:hypothetical protein n=1 Tax=Nocardia cyriacigeorgica TaxID=135487 RepID=UPI001893C523|nr:hypothetical protein [Nocardia cyriacigeorgica]MBF6085132.1 hypothetical protein [Nocardia cyriacigeorgica]